MKRSPGSPLELGVSKKDNIYHFAIFSEHAEKVSLCLFDENGEHLLHELHLDPKINRTGQIWHIGIEGLNPKLLYGYRFEGPIDPARGLFYKKETILSDPYAKELFTPIEWGEKNLKGFLCKIALENGFDWENTKKPQHKWDELVIYEMHVRGFTKHQSSKVEHPGTFLGVIEKIPYLLDLGVNAIELMPIFEFYETAKSDKNPITGEDLYNYWGYSPVNFFSPMNRYASPKDHSSSRDQFRKMVKELHKNGIEVILDVVYNHTVEGEVKDLYINFKGIENPSYYIYLNGHYYNYTGCGNTINANKSVVQQMILDSLRYWALDMGVDGFRFDLASILTRDPHGTPLDFPPIIRWIGTDPFLADVKLIAEPWDAAGLYQVGQFPSYGKWSEWNDFYRDSMRKFIKGTNGQASPFASSLCGSPNLYGKYGSPNYSINFITAHDGYTLRDLVTYQKKHNLENGENNQDGTNSNENWNCGVEGPSELTEIEELRERQMRNFLIALFSSQGVPMLLMGDEYGHTRKGNNNAWCQDNELNWFLWNELKKNEKFYHFVKNLIHFRKHSPLLHNPTFPKEHVIDWHGALPHEPEWSNEKRLIAFTLKDPKGDHLYAAFNAYDTPLEVRLPDIPLDRHWNLIAASYLPSPNDFPKEGKYPLKDSITLPGYSSIISKCLISSHL